MNGKSIIETKLSAPPSFTLMMNLFRTIRELFKVDEQLQFTDRPHLFTIGAWRQSSIEEFAHIGSREDVYRALRILAEKDFIDVSIKAPDSDQFLLRLRADVILKIIKEIKKAGACEY
jgi:hypothetical protein